MGLRNGFVGVVDLTNGFVEVVGSSEWVYGMGFLGFGNEGDDEVGRDDSPVLWALLDERAWSLVGRGRDRFWVVTI